MARKGKNNGEGIWLIGALLAPLAAIVAWFHYQKLMSKYQVDESVLRVHEGGRDALMLALLNCIKATIPAVIVVAVYIYLAPSFEYSSSLSQGVFLFVMAILAALSLIWFYVMSKKVGCMMVGVLFYPQANTIVIPRDSLTNTAMADVFALKWVVDMYTMEAIDLNAIKKITRQSGKWLFIHGDFGTRGIYFSNKQKRDECISAIEHCMKKTMVRFDFEGFV